MKATVNILLTLTATLILICSTAARAQEQPEASSEDTAPAEATTPAEEEPEIEEIIITGSYISRKDLTTPAPVSIIGPLELDASGEVFIGDILQESPFQSGGMNAQFNRYGDGSSRVSLRGLGYDRTLILVNGRRHVYGGLGADVGVDLNAIPASIVDRVEILRDGASPLYGSDAIGGVINIITKKEYSRVEAQAYSGISQHGDGLVYDLNFTAGQAFDAGNILFSAGITESRPVWARDRSFHSFVREVKNWDPNQDPADCPGEMIGGVCTIPLGSWPASTIIGDFSGDPGNQEWQSCLERYPDNPFSVWIIDSNGCRPFDYTSEESEKDKYNRQQDEYLVTPRNSYHIHSLGHHRILENVNGFFEATHSSRRSEQRYASFTLPPGFGTVSADNFYNPYGRDFPNAGRRMTESDAVFSQDVDTFRGVLGLDGTIPASWGPFEGWRWELSYQYGRTVATAIDNGLLLQSRIEKALGPSFRDSDGSIVCGTPDEPDYDCVPLDFFSGAGTITKEMIDYLSYTGINRGFNELETVRFFAGGKLFDLPLDGRVAVAFGYDYREEAGGHQPDSVLAAGESATQSPWTVIGGGFFINEVFAEISAQVVPGLAALEILEVTGSARLVDYNVFGTHAVWKAGARWQVIEDLAVRGTFTTSFRAPSMEALYNPQVEFMNFWLSDPCNEIWEPLEGNPLANCREDGIPEGFEDQRIYVPILVGGNPDLGPETAEVATAGLVFQPGFVEGLSTTVDIWWIRLRDTIGGIGAGTILNACYLSDPDEREFCDLIHRDPDTHLIEVAENVLKNFDQEELWGIDVGLHYDIGTPAGNFLWIFSGAYQREVEEVLPGGEVVREKKIVDEPRWRFNTGVHWRMDEWVAGFDLRFTGPFEICEEWDCSTERFDENDQPREIWTLDVDPYVIVDLHASYALKTTFGTTRFAVGIKNVLDADPRFIPEGEFYNSYPDLYDFMGRYFYFRLTQGF